jgi:pimeloyl-ACP methyl ester carboxylesterase
MVEDPMNSTPPAGPRTNARARRVRRWMLLAVLVGVALWAGWSEYHPEQERELRLLVQDQLHLWFPDAMQPPEGTYGLFPRTPPASDALPRVVLVHGLDEPGGIWDDLVPALEAAGFEAWEFRYPNDQAIDQSADLLAARWPELPADRPVALVGHSMGGLVVRDFVSRWRHPVEDAAAIAGAPVRGVILAGTPSQGSEWARLRVWLELRDHFAAIPARRFSLFAGLRDGTGVAKIDLRPGSRFLQELNARPWPAAVPVRVIGGQLVEVPAAMTAGIDAIQAELGSDELAGALRDWWTDLGDGFGEGLGEGLGDGVVAVASLDVPGAPPPLLLPASHRGMLLGSGESTPPAIAPILELLIQWDDQGSL